MRRIFLISIAVIYAISSALTVYAAECGPAASQTNIAPDDPYALEFINQSDLGIKGIYIEPAGSDKWSENFIQDTILRTGEKLYLDIGRTSIQGFCSLKIVYESNEEKIWENMPIVEIYSIKHNKNRELEYERIKPGT